MNLYRNLSDHDLVELLKSADDNAYEEIYKRYWAILFRHACKILHNEDEAKDVIQDLFTALWTKRRQINLNSSLSSYLYSATRYKIFDLIDKHKVRSQYLASLESFIHEGQCSSEDGIREKQLAVLIEKEIAGLPVKMREVFELSRKSNLSHKEIAKKMGISDQTVKKQIYNAIKILRPKFGLLLLILRFFSTN
ncbi:RNA polymerase sigma-70 factor [Pedobacter heparinus]|uniref:RNA polymerase sigma factor n=1 Tax=Pedobacter heparinus TaxID=984 RepID=UPI00292E767F|nr:RNA polymerase sigma-70 factor [Pedobacter heparinus]